MPWYQAQIVCYEKSKTRQTFAVVKIISGFEESDANLKKKTTEPVSLLIYR